jgi:hypothetical protein
MEEVKASNLRSKIKCLVDRELNQVEERMKDLEPEKRLDLLLKLMPFVLPKVKDTNYEIDDNFDFLK